MGVSRQIVRLDALPAALAALIAESQQQGFRFLCRLRRFYVAADYRRQGYAPVGLPDVSHRKTLAGVSS
ncbi:hypothetical protein [Dickeya zeae]|uniref:Uncharacterized protein n=1 Tax=Dickeya zeae TaxID=204042 RepID=A0ABX8VXN8_9GAMM|nr:hypothetical protein [Dickeya zeae]QYM92447.1 hypothetical protein FGI21_11480 [Dickeya zeae]